MVRMKTARTHALLALTAAGLLWGTSVPLTKAALGGFGPLWLTTVRFGLAGLLLLVVFRPRLRGLRPALVGWGAVGYGGVVAVQNLGLEMTSVTHAALLLGAVPVMVALLAVVFEGARVGLLAWGGFALSSAGIALVAGAGGGPASLAGDGLVLVSVLIGAAFTLVQARLLPGTDVVAASAAQFLSSALLAVPLALAFEGVPRVAAMPSGSFLAAGGLVVIGTVFPYTLFAFGQTGVPSHVAGVFLNLETLIAAALGVMVFGEPMAVAQAMGAGVLLTGIVLSAGRKQAGPAPEPRPVPEPVAGAAPSVRLVLEPAGALGGRAGAGWDTEWDDREAA
jgi:drug/metabolite transporter (DMT)-like permease